MHLLLLVIVSSMPGRSVPQAVHCAMTTRRFADESRVIVNASGGDTRLKHIGTRAQNDAPQPTVRVLWDALTVRLPAGTRKDFQPANLGFGTYRFSTPNGEHEITLQLDFLDPPGFLTHRQLSMSRRVALKGLRAWRYVHGRTVSIQANLPKGRACHIQFYALIAYNVGDRWAGAAARTLSLWKGWRCPNAVP